MFVLNVTVQEKYNKVNPIQRLFGLSDPLPIPIIPKAVWEGKCACCGGRVWADEPPLDIESVKETDCGS